MLTPGIASSQAGGATEQFKFEDEAMRLTVPDDTNDGASTLLDEDQRPPDITMSDDNTDDAVKDDPHHLEIGAGQFSDSYVPYTVPGGDPEADYEVESHQGSPLPDHAIFGGGPTFEQPSITAPSLVVEAPDDQDVASAIQTDAHEIITKFC